MRDSVSVTAIGAALMRAVHTRLDTPRLIDDPWPDRLLTAADRDALWAMVGARLGEEERARLRDAGDRDGVLDTVMRTSPPYGGVVLRTRYTEDCLAAAVRDGTGQYLIIGAGFDSFALRRPAWARDLQVFEVDHPATQEHKRDRLARIGVTPPSTLHLVAADLAVESLDAALERSPFDPAKRTFVAWLGVTPYLTREQNLATLRAVAAIAAAGSDLVFTYTDQRALDARDAASDGPLSRVREAVAAAGEPWVSGFDPARLGDDLRATGLDLVEDLDGNGLHDRYLAAGDGPFPTPAGHIARARVALS